MSDEEAAAIMVSSDSRNQKPVNEGPVLHDLADVAEEFSVDLSDDDEVEQHDPVEGVDYGTWDADDASLLDFLKRVPPDTGTDPF